MLSRQPAISDLAKEFPQLAGSPAWASEVDSDRQWSEFAQLLRRLHAQGQHGQVQAAFDRMEEFLQDGHPSRVWATGFLQSLQEITTWECDDGEQFLRFLGSRTRHVWSTLDAIRFDLADCSTLEAEVLMWRVVHHHSHKSRSC
jgi:hypothetical protein